MWLFHCMYFCPLAFSMCYCFALFWFFDVKYGIVVRCAHT